VCSPAHSVLIPAFNAVTFVAEAIESALAQTMSNLEVVVIDNASTDGTWSAIRKLVGRDSRVRVLLNDSNLGPVWNWRRCVTEATGETCGFLFADDILAPRFLESTLPYLKSSQVGFAYSSVKVSGDGWREPFLAYQLPAEGILPVEAYIAGHTAESVYAVPYSPACAVFRTEDLRASLGRPMAGSERFGFFAHGAGPDVRCYWDACARYPAFAHCRAPLVTFRSHQGNLSKRPDIRAAYHRAWLDWLAEGWLPGIDRRRARARAWLALRGDPRRADVVGKLEYADYARLPALVANRIISRARRAFVLPDVFA